MKCIKCLFVMQLPNSKWRPFLKIKIFLSGKTRKILEKSGNFVSGKSINSALSAAFVDFSLNDSCSLYATHGIGTWYGFASSLTLCEEVP